jgi:hypothetical protein
MGSNLFYFESNSGEGNKIQLVSAPSVGIYPLHKCDSYEVQPLLSERDICILLPTNFF